MVAGNRFSRRTLLFLGLMNSALPRLLKWQLMSGREPRALLSAMS